MTAIKIRPFGGMIPRRGDKHLPDSAASDAENCLLLSGELRPLHAPSLINDFFPPATHQEIVDANGPEINPPPSDPFPAYKELVDANVAPVVWVRGWQGILNEGTGSAALWVDVNGLAEPMDGTLGGLDDDPPTVLFPDASLFQQALIRPPDASGRWAWAVDHLGSGLGSSGGRDEDTEVTLTWNLNGEVQYFSGAEGSGPWGNFPRGWPVSWSLFVDQVYNQSTDPMTPTVDPARATFTVTDGSYPEDLPSGEIIPPTIITTTDANGPSVTVGGVSGIDLVYNGKIDMTVQANTDIAFETGEVPDVSTRTVMSAIAGTPRQAQFGINDLDQDDPATLLCYVDFQIAHPLGVNIDANQTLWASGEAMLRVSVGGALTYVYRTPENLFPPTVVGSITPGTRNVLVWQQDSNGSEVRFWVNGVKTYEGNAGRWRLSPDNRLFTGMTFFQTSPSSTSRRPLLKGIREFTLWDVTISEADVIAMTNAILGAPPP